MQRDALQGAARRQRRRLRGRALHGMQRCCAYGPGRAQLESLGAWALWLRWHGKRSLLPACLPRPSLLSLARSEVKNWNLPLSNLFPSKKEYVAYTG